MMKNLLHPERRFELANLRHLWETNGDAGLLEAQKSIQDYLAKEGLHAADKWKELQSAAQLKHPQFGDFVRRATEAKPVRWEALLADVMGKIGKYAGLASLVQLSHVSRACRDALEPEAIWQMSYPGPFFHRPPDES